MERNKLSTRKDDWKKCEKNNVTIAFNVLDPKKEKTCPAYISKHNSNHRKQFILLMIPNGKGPVQSKTLATQAKPEGCKVKSKE